FEQHARHAYSAFVEYAPIHDDALADRAFAGPGEVVDQVVVAFAEDLMAENWAGDLAQRVVQRQQRLLRRAEHGRLVPGGECRRMPVPIALKEGAGLRRQIGLLRFCSEGAASGSVVFAIFIAWLAAGTPA